MYNWTRRCPKWGAFQGLQIHGLFEPCLLNPWISRCTFESIFSELHFEWIQLNIGTRKELKHGCAKVRVFRSILSHSFVSKYTFERSFRFLVLSRFKYTTGLLERSHEFWIQFCRVLTIQLLFFSAKSMHFRWFSRFWLFLLGSSTGFFAKWLSFGAFVVYLCDFYAFSTFRSVVGAF